VLRLVDGRDPMGPEWATVHDVPPVEVNRLGVHATIFFLSGHIHFSLAC
jgi:hypothetical protein